MIEKIGHIKNPLTVIAIFAGLAEVSGTIVLPLLSLQTQQTFVWFLMIFPSSLVVLFFLTLLLKHHVLYAPTDFRSDDAFTGLLVPATGATRFAKLDQEAKEYEAAEIVSSEASSAGSAEMISTSRRDFRATALLAEELVSSKLARELGVQLERNVAFKTAPNLVFDAVANLPSRTLVIEVKYLRTASLTTIDAALSRFLRLYNTLPVSVQKEFEAVFAIVTEGNLSHRHRQLEERITQAAGAFPFRMTVRLFDLESLDSQMGSGVTADDDRAVQEKLEKRIIGVLGAGRSLSLTQLLAELGVKKDDSENVANVQAAIGELLDSDRIEHNVGTIEDYQLKRPRR